VGRVVGGKPTTIDSQSQQIRGVFTGSSRPFAPFGVLPRAAQPIRRHLNGLHVCCHEPVVKRGSTIEKRRAVWLPWPFSILTTLHSYRRREEVEFAHILTTHSISHCSSSSSSSSAPSLFLRAGPLSVEPVLCRAHCHHRFGRPRRINAS